MSIAVNDFCFITNEVPKVSRLLQTSSSMSLHFLAVFQSWTTGQKGQKFHANGEV